MAATRTRGRDDAVAMTEQTVTSACWDQVMACLEAVRRQDCWGLTCEWLVAMSYENGQAWATHGGLLGTVLTESFEGVEWDVQGVGSLANECWRFTSSWLDTSEAEYFDVLTRLLVTHEHEGISPDDGYLFLVVAAVLLERTSDPFSTLERTRELLVPHE
jgi:hypothetical protein